MAGGNPPRELRIATPKGPVEYRLAEGLFAVKDGPGRGRALAGVSRVEFEGGEVQVYEGRPPSDLPESELVPVYRTPAGSLAVATGRVFLRLREPSDVRKQTRAIGDLGLRIESVPSYAPQAAWLRAASGLAADALARLADLEQLPDVERAEPQLLLPAPRR